MLATGGLLVSIALLTLAAVAPLFRSSNPPRWTTRGWVGELVTLVIVCTLAVGVGYLGAGAIEAFTVGIDYLDLGLLGVVLLVAVVIWRQWQAHVRPRTLAAEASLGARVVQPGHTHADRPVPPASPAPMRASKRASPRKAA